MKKKKSIVFVNQYYLPEKNPPAKRISAFAEYFAKKGWQVKVITGNPNYPAGKFFKTYGFTYKKELINGVEVHRLPIIPSKNEGLIKRMLNYWSYACSIKLYKKLLDADVAFISSPPLFGALSAHRLARKKNIPIVLDIRDLWPESFVTLDMVKKSNVAYLYLRKQAKKMYAHSDAVITIADGMSKQLKKETRKPVLTITNFAKQKIIHKNNHSSKKISVVFTGLITDAQDLKSFLECNADKGVQKKFEWHFVGDGNQLKAIRDDVQKNNWKNVNLYAYKPYDFCEKMIQKADICLLSLAQKELFKFALPSKFFEYLSHGKAVMSFWSRETDKYITKYDAGYSILKKEDILPTLLRIKKSDIQKKEKNAQRLFKEHFEQEQVCGTLYQLIEGLL